MLALYSNPRSRASGDGSREIVGVTGADSNPRSRASGDHGVPVVVIGTRNSNPRSRASGDVVERLYAVFTKILTRARVRAETRESIEYLHKRIILTRARVRAETPGIAETRYQIKF